MDNPGSLKVENRENEVPLGNQLNHPHGNE